MSCATALDVCCGWRVLASTRCACRVCAWTRCCRCARSPPSPAPSCWRCSSAYRSSLFSAWLALGKRAIDHNEYEASRKRTINHRHKWLTRATFFGTAYEQFVTLSYCTYSLRPLSRVWLTLYRKWQPQVTRVGKSIQIVWKICRFCHQCLAICISMATASAHAGDWVVKPIATSSLGFLALPV